MSLTLAIQAGGLSRRMGQNKALMQFRGQTLVERIIKRLAPAVDETIVIGNQPDELAFLGIPVIKDRWPYKGPLGGLFTALEVASHPLVAVVACDLPFASPELIRFEAREMEKSGDDVAIPLVSGLLEPLHAMYRKRTCLPAVRDALEHEQLKLIAWFPGVKVLKIAEEEIRKFDPDLRAFINVNTPEEFYKAALME